MTQGDDGRDQPNDEDDSDQHGDDGGGEVEEEGADMHLPRSGAEQRFRLC